jgi:predicted dehydrogenase
MLSKEKLDAVLIATPDWVHAPQTITCLKAGIPVYCEKAMAPDVESARGMVKASRETGKLLQIGHQRRSNPRYKHALRLIEKDGILGRVTTINGQWNRSVQEPLGWPEKFTMTPEQLQRWGYENMDQFRNWRWYRKYSGGPIHDLGSHQIEVYNWFLGANPTAVMASGGNDYYSDGREWYDNVMAVYEYPTEGGVVRALYQVSNTTSFGGYFEAFMGDEGTLVISEDVSRGYLIREARAQRREWEDLSEKVQQMGRDAIELKIGETRRSGAEASPEALKAEADLEKPEHQPHLENFFAAIRGEEALACPGEVGFAACVTVLKVNEAVAAQKRLEFKPEDFLA